jgi:hypothetical protein
MNESPGDYTRKCMHCGTLIGSPLRVGGKPYKFCSRTCKDLSDLAKGRKPWRRTERLQPL